MVSIQTPALGYPLPTDGEYTDPNIRVTTDGEYTDPAVGSHTTVLILTLL